MKDECEHGLDTRLPCGDCQKAYEAENAASSCSSQSDGSARGVRCECGRVLLYAASIKHGKCRICRQNVSNDVSEGSEAE
jgi:hypothetical protein